MVLTVDDMVARHHARLEGCLRVLIVQEIRGGLGVEAMDGHVASTAGVGVLASTVVHVRRTVCL